MPKLSAWPVMCLAALAPVLLLREGYTFSVERLVPILRGTCTSSVDHRHFYDAGVRLRNGPSHLYPENSVRTLTGFLYPPQSALLFVPLSFMSFGWGYLFCAATSYACVLLSMLLWFRVMEVDGAILSRRWKWATVVLCLASGPAFMNAYYSQVNALVLLLSVGAVWYAVSKRGWLAASLLSCAIWLKVFPVLLVSVLLRPSLRRILRPLAVCLLALPLVAWAATPWVPWFDLSRGYFGHLLPSMSQRAIMHILNQSLEATTYRILWFDPATMSGAIYPAYIVPAALRALNWIVILSVCAWIVRRKQRMPYTQAAALILALMPITAPLGWGYTYVLALPAAVVALHRSENGAPWMRIVTMVSWLGLCVPSYTLAPEFAPAVLAVTFYSRYLLSTLVLATVAEWPAAVPLRASPHRWLVQKAQAGMP